MKRSKTLSTINVKTLWHTLPLYILILLVLGSFAGGSGFSLYMNAEFGASRVGELGRWVAVICDLFKIGLSGALLFFHHWFSRFMGLVGILAFAILSIFSSYGYYIQNIDHKVGEHRAVKKRYHTLQNRKQELLQSLGKLGQYRSIKALEQDITARKRDRIYTDKRRSNQCRNATIEESRIFCDRLRKLEVALEKARFANPRIIKIQGQLSQIQMELSGINLTLVIRKVDPFAQSFGDADRFNLYFNMFLAFLIEIATTAGLPLVLVLLRAAAATQKRVEHAGSLNEQADERKRKGTGSSSPNSLDQFLEEEMVIQHGNFIETRRLRSRYFTWCVAASISKPLNTPQISAYMEWLGYKPVRRKGKSGAKRLTGYVGLAFKPEA